jgi:multidrug efflux pump subunit AcrA (membrane-fusion protein)
MMRAVCLVMAIAGCAHDADPELVEVKRGDLVLEIDATGDLDAADSARIQPPAIPGVWDFKIAWLAPEGSEVKTGDAIVRFDPTELETRLQTLRADAQEGQKRLDQKREEAELAQRIDRLKLVEADAAARKATLKIEVPPDLLASVEVRERQLDAELKKLTLEHQTDESARARRVEHAAIEKLAVTQASTLRQIDEVQREIPRLTVTAPRSGTVVYMNAADGEKIKIGADAYRMQTFMQIVGLGVMVGNAQVDEVDVARIARGQRVSLQFDALPDVVVRGTLDSIAKTVQPRSDTDPSKIVRVKITVEPTKAALRPGMRFRGRIETLRVPDVVQVQRDAVFITPYGPVAYLETSGDLAAVPLVLGRRSLETIEVISGLSPGDRVSRVEPGAR